MLDAANPHCGRDVSTKFEHFIGGTLLLEIRKTPPLFKRNDLPLKSL